VEWDGPVVRCYSFGCENRTVHVLCLVEGVKDERKFNTVSRSL